MQPKMKLIVNQFLQLADAAERDDLIRFRSLLADGADANATVNAQDTAPLRGHMGQPARRGDSDRIWCQY